MLKEKSLRKILVSTAALFTLALLYLIPKGDNLTLDMKQELEYVNNDVLTNEIYLLNNHGMLAKTKVVVDNTTVEKLAKEIIGVLTLGGVGENRIPSGFKAILPADTKVISINFENNLLKVNFSTELLNINEIDEEKMIEAIVYSLTSIDGVNDIIIYVDNNILSKLPKTGKILPSTLNRSFGINKEYELESLKDITNVTIYYIDSYNDEYYYVPVTKYVNDDRDKIRIVIDELSSSPIYNTNLMSFLNSNTRLLEVEQTVDALDLTFNSYIFNNLEEKKILEEVIYTICLSIRDNYDVNEVIINVDDEQICYSSVKR